MCHCSISLVLLTHLHDPVCLIIRIGTQHVKIRGMDTFCECHTTDTSVFCLFFLIVLFVKSLFPPVSRLYMHWFSTQVSVVLTMFTCPFFPLLLYVCFIILECFCKLLYMCKCVNHFLGTPSSEAIIANLYCCYAKKAVPMSQHLFF